MPTDFEELLLIDGEKIAKHTILRNHQSFSLTGIHTGFSDIISPLNQHIKACIKK